MAKRIVCIAVVLGLLTALAGQVGASAEAVMPTAAPATVEVAAPSAILMDAATGTILMEKNAHEQLPLASVTKIMTLLLVVEALDSGKITWEDTVTASEAAAAKGGSQVYLEAGEQMPIRDMIKSVTVSSANDCATALAEHVAGSEAAFVELMNQRAAELGMEDTHFVNCTGLDDEPEAEKHLSSAYDIAVMSRQLLQHDEIREFTTIWMDTVRDGQFGLSNTNKLVRFYDGTTGLKTGYTSSAGHCLSASAERNGMELIAVVLHCSSSSERFESAKALLDFGFANYALVQVESEDLTIDPVPVTLGTSNTVQPVLEDSTPLLIDKGLQASITRTVELTPSVSAPVQQGQRLGSVVIQADQEVLAEVPLVASEAVERQNLWQIAGRLLRHLAMCA